MREFWITIEHMDEQEARTLWKKHKGKDINCTVMFDRVFIYGIADEQTIGNIVDDIITLGKDYGLTSKEVIQ